MSDAKRLRALWEENRRLKRVVADQALNRQVLKRFQMPKIAISFVGLVLLVASADRAHSTAGVTRSALSGQCFADTAHSSDGQVTRKGIARMVEGNTERDSIFRSAYDLPQAPDTAVKVVDADSLCAVAVSRMHEVSGVGAVTDSTWLLRVGTTRYIAFNGKHITVGRMYGFVFDSTFTFLTEMLF